MAQAPYQQEWCQPKESGETHTGRSPELLIPSMGPPKLCQGVLVLSAGKFAWIPLEIQLFHDKEYFPCLSCPFRLWFITIILTSAGLVVLAIVKKSEVTALTLQICCQRQDTANRQEKQNAGVEKGWGSKN